VATAVTGLVATEALFVLSALNVRRTFKALATDLNVNTFEKAGLLYLIGAATIIVGIGLVLIIIAEILLGVAFFSIRDQQTIASTTQAPAIGRTI